MFKNWWYGWRGPVYKWMEVKDVFKHILFVFKLKDGKCSGCGSITRKNYSLVYRKHICGNCGWTIDTVMDSLVSHVMNPNGDWT